MLDSVKAQYETTSRYGATQNLVHLRQPRRPMPKQETLDMLADRALDGGWKAWKTGTCDECFEVRSVNGACGCA